MKPSTSEARQYKVRGLATLRKRKRTKQSGGDKSTFKAVRYVVYCPECPRSHVDPELDSRISGIFRQGTKLRCAKGHTFVTV